MQERNLYSHSHKQYNQVRIILYLESPIMQCIFSCPQLNLVFVAESKGLYHLRGMKFGAREKALLSCLKSPFPSLSNSCHVG